MADHTTASDHIAIVDVLNAYATNLDKRAPEAMDEVFTADAVIDLGYGQWDGLQRAVDEYKSELTQFGGTAHVLTNHRVNVDGDTAKATCYVTAWHWPLNSDDPAPEADFVSIGVYIDDLRRTAAGWRITRRRYRRLGPSAIALGSFPDFIKI